MFSATAICALAVWSRPEFGMDAMLDTAAAYALPPAPPPLTLSPSLISGEPLPAISAWDLARI